MLIIRNEANLTWELNWLRRKFLLLSSCQLGDHHLSIQFWTGSRRRKGKKSCFCTSTGRIYASRHNFDFLFNTAFFVHSALCIALIPVGISRNIVGLCRGVGTSPAQSAGCETGAWSGSFQTGDPLCHIVSEYVGGNPQSFHHNSWGLQPSKTRFPSSDLTFSLQGFLSSLKWLTATGADVNSLKCLLKMNKRRYALYFNG